MNSSSDFIVQTAPVWGKNAKINPSHTSPNILAEGVGSTTTAVSRLESLDLINNFILLDHGPVNRLV